MFSLNYYFLLWPQTIYLVIVICYLITSTFNLKCRFLSQNFDYLSYNYDFYLMGLPCHKHPFQIKGPVLLSFLLWLGQIGLFFCSGSRISAAQSRIASFHSLLWAEGFVSSRRTDWNRRPHRCRYFKHVFFLHHSVFSGFLGIADIIVQG